MTDAFSSPPHQPPYRPPHSPHPPHTSSPSYRTYPWDPQEPAAAPAPRSARTHPPLGHHSDLRVLRSAYRWQRRVATLAALGYFVLFLVLSAFAPSFMTSEVSGGLSTGLLLGLLQVPVTCLAIWLYEHTARHRVDPLADRIRELAAADARRGAAR
ncbi:conserved hypothetical protein [Streptomyces scabiei 87.22]|uniref:Integral membrane protein n=6 Tax=Streptomyces TaxID=1883 RepID=C9YY21_STRSW|nr:MULTISPECIES: DUF485 domain-containing protein [Streptomyces]MBP5863238.1 DUF485 domain-containing protein [Streptomyces sp. LBUM 1484]MBP5876270.1 DUF485 domain-containing protein [Streptomyces sp. LBUM 1477]MBP5884010.1 DUF485 domain-containing protein [Streptomyces sp. LBUM 1487]MBP5893186.1 DUF485 domain-containing protein [Streptomyces sp. LBUM 1481]MBP5900027.1 DUF485 domain-containing protein [Streptomyces sp. LBUM 1488]